MKKQLLSSASIAALVIAGSAPALLSGQANAADLGRPVYKAPPPAPAPVYSWTGCYAGAQVGWGWGTNHFNNASFSVGGLIARGNNTSFSSSGALFGGQVGCNYQFASNWVLGIQGDFAGTDINGSGFDPYPPGNEDTISVKTDWLGSVTGRLGYAFWNNQVLAYVKGGVAWDHNKWNFVTGALDCDAACLSQETRTGWTIGGGFEWTLWSPAWTAFVEYNFYDFNDGTTFTNGPDHTDGPIKTNTFTTGRQEINTVKVGVNYKFWGGAGGWGGQ